MRNIDFARATAPNLTCLWVDVDGQLLFGGPVQGWNYTESAQTLVVTANDFYQYFSQRLQAKDYTNNWGDAATAAGATEIADTIVTDALAASHSLPIGVQALGTPTPIQYEVMFSAPLSQQQTVDSLLSQLQQMGYNLGFDFYMYYEYVSNTPSATLVLAYPRAGRVAGTTGLVLDTTNATEVVWSVDGTQQANRVVELGTSTGGVGAIATYAPSTTVDGYPLLEMVGTESELSPVGQANEPNHILNAWAKDDLALYAFPVVTPQITQGAFQDSMSLGEWIVGDDTRVIVPKDANHSSGWTSGGGTPYDSSQTYDSSDAYDSTASFSSPLVSKPSNPLFPDGLDYYLRIVRADVTIADEGLSTVTYTLNQPPGEIPQMPPGIS